MNKMLSIFFSGCMLIGIGLGVTVIELKNWRFLDENPCLLDMPQETYTQNIAFDTTKPSNIEIYWYSHDFTYENVIIEEKMDCTDNIEIEIIYRGAAPGISLGSIGNNADKYNLFIFEDGYDIMHHYDIVKSMFVNKAFYRWSNVTHIDKIMLYTASPENLRLVY